MNILLVEPYYGGSHRAWADGYQQFSQHPITLLTLPSQFWKWRMQGGAVTMARLMEERNLSPDVILASDMLNLATFRALSHKIAGNIPVALYFHETQLTYPQNTRQKHGWRYGFINYVSALVADAVFFNSSYHHDIFFETLPNMLKHFGDCNELSTVDLLRKKSSVLALGMNLRRYDEYKPTHLHPNLPPLIVWNHRWEEDKNPGDFFSALWMLAEQDVPFRVAITGENFQHKPQEFEEARKRLGWRVAQYGYLPSFVDYARLLWEADYVVSTSNQDFFGSAIAEAVYCGCIPILPDRLNYSFLIPEPLRPACLYKGKSPARLLKRHLDSELTIDITALQDHILQFDWATMASIYDNALEQLTMTVD